MKIIGYISTAIIVAAYGVVLNGWVLSKLWAWFIVTTFGLPTLAVPEAIGLATVVSFLSAKIDRKDDEIHLGYITFMTTIKAFVFLGLGAIVKMWL